MQPTDFNISPLTQILVFAIGGTLFVVLALFTSRLIRPNRPNPQKLSSYESGETPQGIAWVQFNMRFYVLALIFILFEVEIVFLFPWAVVFANDALNAETSGSWSWFAFTEMLLFIVILAIGLIYAWKMGHLDWVKSKPVASEFKSTVPSQYYHQVNEKYKSRLPKK